MIMNMNIQAYDKPSLAMLRTLAEEQYLCGYANCRAGIGEKCRTRSGRFREHPHKIRLVAVIRNMDEKGTTL